MQTRSSPSTVATNKPAPIRRFVKTASTQPRRQSHRREMSGISARLSLNPYENSATFPFPLDVGGNRILKLARSAQLSLHLSLYERTDLYCGRCSDPICESRNHVCR